MKKNCVIRVDGGNLIGFGHLRRCLALIESLDNYCNIFIVIKEITKSIKREFLKHDVTFIFLTNKKMSGQQESKYILSIIPNVDIIIFDGYQFNGNNKKIFKKNNIKVVTIDDEAKNYSFSHCVINHAPKISEKKFRSKNNIDFRLGTKYLMVQKCFIKNQRSINLYKKIKNNIFICLGSSSKAERVIINILKKLFIHSNIDNIFLVYNKKINFNKIPIIRNNQNRLKIYSNLSADKMLYLMKKSKIGICSSSTVALECCSIKLPLIVGSLIKNQENIYDGLIRSKMAFGIGKFNNNNTKNINTYVSKLLNKNNIATNMIKNQNKNIDNLSHNHLRINILKDH